ncbi:MAG: MarR family transcriptional regulator, partial [Lutibacter sp.]|nr:MarR family transcriptional regulator [Lutibacter sp.]
MILSESIIPWIGKTSKMIAASLNNRFKAEGIDLTREQLVVLIMLSENDCRAQHSLAIITESDKTSLSRLIKKMEHKQLIRRFTTDQDKRVKHISISPLGEETLEMAYPIIREQIAAFQQGISPTEIEMAIDTI